MKQALSEVANSVLTSKAMLQEKLFVVNQSRLACNGKFRRERFSHDGLHLADRGIAMFTGNIISVIIEQYTDLQGEWQNKQQQSQNHD